MVAYLHEIEGEFCDTVERSRCYYVSQLQQSGQLDEDSMATLFQNIDMVGDLLVCACFFLLALCV